MRPKASACDFRCRAGARQEHHSAFEHDDSKDGTYSLAVEGATTTVVFEAYVERILAPGFRKGQVVFMDNLGRTDPREEENCTWRGIAS